MAELEKAAPAVEASSKVEAEPADAAENDNNNAGTERSQESGNVAARAAEALLDAVYTTADVLLRLKEKPELKPFDKDMAAAKPDKSLSPEFRFDRRGPLIADAAGKDSHLFPGLYASSFKDPFKDAFPVSGFSLTGSKDSFFNQTILTPQQLENFGLGIDRGAFGLTAPRGALGLDTCSWNSFSHKELPKISSFELAEGASGAFFSNSLEKQTVFNKDFGWSKLTDFVLNSSDKLADWGKDTIKDLVSGVGTLVDLGQRESKLSEAGVKVEYAVSGDKRVFATDNNLIMQSKDKTAVSDGQIDLIRDKANDTVTATNENSEIQVVQNGKTGKFDVLDKSGKPVASFDKEGDAKRYFDNAITMVVIPNESEKGLSPTALLNKKYQEFRANLEKEIKEAEADPKFDPAKLVVLRKTASLPIFLMNGRGESLAVEPDRTRYYTHANGDAEIIVPRMLDNPEKPGEKVFAPIEIQIRKDADGKEQFFVGLADSSGERGQREYRPGALNQYNDKFVAASSQEAAKLMERTRFLFDRGRMRRHAWDNPDKWTDLMDRDKPMHLVIAPGAVINLSGAGERSAPVIQINDGRTTALLQQKQGVVTSVETNAGDQNPNRLFIFDTNKRETVIQGIDPITKAPSKDDIITIKSHDQKLTVNAWNKVEMDSDGLATLTNDDGSKTTIKKNGDVEAVDKNGKSILSTDGDRVSFDGGQSYEVLKRAAVEKEQQIALEQARAVAQKIEGIISALLSACLNDPSLIAACEALLGAVEGQLPPGGERPAQVSQARFAISEAKAKFAADNAVNSHLNQISGRGYLQTLREYSQSAPTSDPVGRAVYALLKAGIIEPSPAGYESRN